jgi:RNA polymerase sigma-70 factor (ECF subfamily)
MLSDVGDDSLLRRAASGDAGAFSELVAAHRQHLWSVCFRITGQQQDAEDALQEALTAIWRHLGQYRGDAQLSTWLHRIAVNAALRVAQRRREEPRAVMEDQPIEETHFSTLVAERDALQRALDRLPPDFRATLVLREYVDMTYADIATCQGVGIQTVKSRLNRARNAVATLLQDG